VLITYLSLGEILNIVNNNNSLYFVDFYRLTSSSAVHSCVIRLRQ